MPAILCALSICAAISAQAPRIYTSESGLTNSQINDISQDRDGFIWISTEGGLLRFDGMDFESFMHDRDDSASIITNSVNFFYEDSRGTKWIATAKGLQTFDSEFNTFTLFDFKDSRRPSSDQFVRTIIEIRRADGSSSILASTGGTGIYVIDTKTCEIDRKATETISSSISSDYPGKMYIDSRGRLCVENSEGGKDLIDLRTLKSIEGVPDAKDPVDILNERVKGVHVRGLNMEIGASKPNCAYEDNQGNIWIGLYQKGILVVPKSMFGFTSMDFNSCIMAMIVDEKTSTLWVGSDSEGLFSVKDGAVTSNYGRHNSPIGVSSIMSLAIDSRGTIWIGSYGEGLLFLERNGRIVEYPCAKEIGHIAIRALCYDKANDRMYVGTYGAGMFIVDAETKEILGNVDNDDNRWVSSFYLDQFGLLWMGTYNGPARYDPVSGRMTMLNLLKEGNVRVYAISGDDKGSVWFGTGEGLFRYNVQTGQVRQFLEDDGLSNNVVRGIVCVSQEEVWASTARGLSRYSASNDKFTNYYSYDGLQGNEFRSASSFIDQKGRVYFGGTGGLSCFMPQMVDGGGHHVPQVQLKGLTIQNKSIEYSVDLGKRNLIDRHISKATRIKIPHGGDVFSIEFAVPEFTDPQRVVYSYRLSGFDSGWQSAKPGYRFATYTNVNHGRYRFEVKAFFDGKEDEYTFRSISVRIMPPAYLKWWAWLIYLLLAGLVGWTARKNYRKEKQRQLERQEAEIKEMKLGMFTNLTHEIRTPLSLVMNPLKKIRENEIDPDKKDTYNLMHRNCLRINRLVDQLMDIRKIDGGQMKLHFRKTDIVYFIKDIMKSFEPLANSRGIDFTITSDKDEASLWVDQGNFDKIVFNILSNAFKFTPDNGRIRVGVHYGEEGMMCISIFNSGSHIDEQYNTRIFERFFQIGQADTRSGSGVGLNLTKMLVDLHHGSISVRNIGDGVEFLVNMPEGKEHLTEDELSETQHHKDLYIKTSESLSEAREDINCVDRQESRHESGRYLKYIILVDDEKQIRDYIVSELRDQYRVESFADGSDAWAAIATKVPDLVVTDLVMPRVDGIELCRRIRQNATTDHIPVIMLTGMTEEENEQRASDCGADRFMKKPVSIELLKSNIAQAIFSRDSIRGKYSPAFVSDYSSVKMKSADEELMERINTVLRENFENPEFNVESLSEMIGISRVHLNRKMKECSNVPPSVLIRTYRLKQAAYLLIYNKVNVSEVAYKVGFSSHSYFTTSFRTCFGLSPSEFVDKYSDCPEEIPFLK